MDREKVIKGLGCCAKWMGKDDFDACNACPYHPHFSYDDHGCLEEVNNDAIALLEEQEPKPVGKEWNECPNCGKTLDRIHDMRYCGVCGQAVKWK